MRCGLERFGPLEDDPRAEAAEDGGVVVLNDGLHDLQVGAEATVNADAGLRVRSGPGTNFDPVIMLPAGTVVLVIDGPQRADTYTWWQIRFQSPEGEELEGWVAGDFLDPGAG